MLVRNACSKKLISLGWMDESKNCTSQFGICQPELCMNGGTCDDQSGCNCTEGYQGIA